MNFLGEDMLSSSPLLSGPDVQANDGKYEAGNDKIEEIKKKKNWCSKPEY